MGLERISRFVAAPQLDAGCDASDRVGAGSSVPSPVTVCLITGDAETALRYLVLLLFGMGLLLATLWLAAF